MDEDQQWENNSLSDNLTTNNNNNSQSDETERKITQTDHLNKQLLNAFLERLNTKQITETSDTQQDQGQGELTEVEWCEEPEKTINVKQELRTSMNCGKTLIIGISGPSNSGKTSLTSRLQKSLPGSSHICQDTYFHSPGDDRLTWVPEVQHHNWELFSALDMDAMVTDVKRWKSKQQDQDKPSILLIEGFTIFNYGSLTELLDKRYFLMASKEVCEMRRLTRDYNPPDVAGYFDKVVWPHYVQTYNDIRDNPNIVFIEEGLTTEEIFMKVKNDIEHCLQIS